jgi:hypothetical protein
MICGIEPRSTLRLRAVDNLATSRRGGSFSVLGSQKARPRNQAFSLRVANPRLSSTLSIFPASIVAARAVESRENDLSRQAVPEIVGLGYRQHSSFDVSLRIMQPDIAWCKRIREFLGLRQSDLEAATGISASKLSAAETGRVKLTEVQERLLVEFLTARLRMMAEIEQEGKE